MFTGSTRTRRPYYSGLAGRTQPVTPVQAKVFALAIVTPAALLQRMTEVYEPSRRTTRHEVTLEIQLPKKLLDESRAEGRRRHQAGAEESGETTEPIVVLFPVMAPLKGELSDRFSLTSADGSLVTPFSYSESLQLAASVLRQLLFKAYRLAEGAKLPGRAQEVELDALHCIMQRGIHAEHELDRVVQAVLGLDVDRAEKATLSLAAELVRNLANRYALVTTVTCTPDGRALLRHERTMIPGLRMESLRLRRMASGLKDRVGLLLGARPVRLSIRLDNAATCQSYHLFVICPDGLYLRRQELPGIDEYLRDEWESRDRRVASVPPYYRLLRRLGQPYAHFYARFFPESRRWRLPDYTVTFFEVPPGSLFRAATAAVSSFLLIWVVGFIFSHGSVPDNDAPAVLLAFPAIIAAWLGFVAPSSRLLEGTLAARISLFGSAAAAIAASALFMMYKAPNLDMFEGSARFLFKFEHIRMSFLGITETSWAVLTACSLANAIYVVYSCLLRTWEYSFLCSRPASHRSLMEVG